MQHVVKWFLFRKTLRMNKPSIYRILERHREGILDVA